MIGRLPKDTVMIGIADRVISLPALILILAARAAFRGQRPYTLNNSPILVLSPAIAISLFVLSVRLVGHRGERSGRDQEVNEIIQKSNDSNI